MQRNVLQYIVMKCNVIVLYCIVLYCIGSVVLYCIEGLFYAKT